MLLQRSRVLRPECTVFRSDRVQGSAPQITMPAQGRCGSRSRHGFRKSCGVRRVRVTRQRADVRSFLPGLPDPALASMRAYMPATIRTAGPHGHGWISRSVQHLQPGIVGRAVGALHVRLVGTLGLFEAVVRLVGRMKKQSERWCSIVPGVTTPWSDAGMHRYSRPTVSRASGR